MIKRLFVFAVVVIVLPSCGESGARRPDRSELRVASPDLSELFRELLDRGPIAANVLRERLDKDDPAGLGEDLVALLPAADEAWNVEVGAMVHGDASGPSPEAFIVEPAGRQLASERRILVRRPMPGRLVAVLRDGEGQTVSTFDVAIGRWEYLPDEVELLPGTRYRLELSAGENDTEAVVSTAFEILSTEEEELLRERLKLLKKVIADVRVRRYMQGVVAMNAGLYGRASDILGKRMVGEVSGSELGRHRRLAWLHHRRGNITRRDQSLAALRR